MSRKPNCSYIRCARLHDRQRVEHHRLCSLWRGPPRSRAATSSRPTPVPRAGRSHEQPFHLGAAVVQTAERDHPDRRRRRGARRTGHRRAARSRREAPRLRPQSPEKTGRSPARSAYSASIARAARRSPGPASAMVSVGRGSSRHPPGILDENPTGVQDPSSDQRDRGRADRLAGLPPPPRCPTPASTSRRPGLPRGRASGTPTPSARWSICIIAPRAAWRSRRSATSPTPTKPSRRRASPRGAASIDSTIRRRFAPGCCASPGARRSIAGASLSRWLRRIRPDHHDDPRSAGSHADRRRRRRTRRSLPRERDRVVAQMIRSLPARLRDPFLLAASGEHRYEDIATMLGDSAGHREVAHGRGAARAA